MSEHLSKAKAALERAAALDEHDEAESETQMRLLYIASVQAWVAVAEALDTLAAPPAPPLEPEPDAEPLTDLERYELGPFAYRKLRTLVQRGMYGVCVHCGASHKLTIGHVVPRAHGGTLADGWRVECLSCNSRAGALIRREGANAEIPD